MSDFDDDAVYLQSRREAVVTLILWAACFIWTVSYCYYKGYTDHDRRPGTVTEYLPDMSAWNRDPQSLETPFGLGIPDWCFWGVAVPWIACIVVSTWFSFLYMTDNEDEEAEYEEGQEVVA